ncbi:plastocyanin/azurin family copper-binding protein [Alphaproteobacteria bacterium]|jgi:pseudoazurin|nr:plastocyanin/azurin family copper-binding protein [Alphaproteobacteria bacterium]
MRFLIICLSLLIASPAIAGDVTVEMLNKDADGNRMVYSQEIVEIAAGSTVKWVPTDKGHNVEIIASPNDMKFKSKNGKEASVTFETPGIYYYWCTPHKGMGMIGLVVVGGDTSNKAQISKAKAIGKSKKKLKALLEQLS